MPAPRTPPRGSTKRPPSPPPSRRAPPPQEQPRAPQERPPVAEPEPRTLTPNPAPSAAPQPPAPSPNGSASRQVTVPPDIDIEADAGAGLEDVGARYREIPTLVLLQANHPQVKRSDALFVEGAAEGRFLNTASGETFDKVVFVPCRFVPDYTEWEPGGITGKLVRRWRADSTGFDESAFEEIDGRSRWTHPVSGNEFTERALIYGLILKLDEDTGRMSFEAAVATLGGTSFRVAKKWLTQLTSHRLTGRDGRSFVAPMWYRAALCESAPAQRDSRSWMMWRVSPYADVLDLPDGADIYRAAKAFAHEVDSGAARVAEDDVQPVREDALNPDNVPF